MSEFYPGQRVICIDGKFHPSVWEFVNEVPIEGEIYTVTHIRYGGYEKITRQPGPALALKEISGSLPACKNEICWIVRRFAPLDLKDALGSARKAKSRKKAKRSQAPIRRQPALA
jgi:hypothetical protein